MEELGLILSHSTVEDDAMVEILKGIATCKNLKKLKIYLGNILLSQINLLRWFKNRWCNN